jgi:hypothetical protein
MFVVANIRNCPFRNKSVLKKGYPFVKFNPLMGWGGRGILSAGCASLTCGYSNFVPAGHFSVVFSVKNIISSF